jgi:phosphomannomutase / phosphoglucomutase
MVTASHIPMDYNGMKLVRQDARPIGGDTGLRDVEALVEAGGFPPPAKPATQWVDADKSAYIDHLLGYVDRAVLR